ncbi:MAG: PAS domain-containing protein, partial [Oscillospiraceae bacterium]
MLLLEEDRSIFSDAVHQFAREPANQNLTYRMRRKDGRVIRVTDHFRSVRMEDGKMWGFGVAIDVTSQYETLAQLKLLTDSIPGGLAVYEYSSTDVDTVYFSDGVCEMIGYTREEYTQIVKNRLAGLIFQEDLTTLHQKIERVVAGVPTIDCVYRQYTKNGGYRWLNLRGRVADRWGDIIRINLFGFQDAAENVPESIVALGVIAPESVDDFLAFYEAIARGEKSGCATICRKTENQKFGWCRSHFTTLFNSAGEPVSAVVSIEDITKQHEQELENKILRQNEELFQIVVSHSDRFIVKYDIQTRTAYVQPRTADTFCSSRILRDVPYGCVKKGGIAEESAQTYLDFYEKMIRGEPTAKAFIKMRRNGQLSQWGWYRFDGSVIFDDAKRPTYAVVSFMEVTQQYEKELAYERISQHVNQLSKDVLLYFEANLT